MVDKRGNKFFLTFAFIVIIIVLVATVSISANMTGNSIFDFFKKWFSHDQESPQYGPVTIQGSMTYANRSVSTGIYLPNSLVSVTLPNTDVTLNVDLNLENCAGAYVEIFSPGLVPAYDPASIGDPLYNPNLNRIAWTELYGPECGGPSNYVLSYNLSANESGIYQVSGEYSVDGTSYPLADNTLIVSPQTLDFSIASGGDKSANQNSNIVNNIDLSMLSGEGAVSLYAVDLPAGVVASFEPNYCLLNSENTSCTSTMDLFVPSSLSAGTYMIKVNATTGFVTKETSFILTVSQPQTPPSTTGGKKKSSRGSTGSSTPIAPQTTNTGQNYTLTEEDLVKGYIRAFEMNDMLLFNVEDQSHSAKIVDIASSFVTLEIRSTPYNLSIDKSKPEYVDLNDDKKYDIALRYDGSTLGKAIVFIQKTVQQEITNNTPAENTNTEEVESNLPVRYALIAIIVLILVIVIVVILIKSFSKKENLN